MPGFEFYIGRRAQALFPHRYMRGSLVHRVRARRPPKKKPPSLQGGFFLAYRVSD